jgi:hypothetical protein
MSYNSLYNILTFQIRNTLRYFVELSGFLRMGEELGTEENFLFFVHPENVKCETESLRF